MPLENLLCLVCSVTLVCVCTSHFHKVVYDSNPLLYIDNQK